MIVAAADGSSLSNPGPAGWAWYVDDTCWAAGGWAHGTNNMGELMAVLDLLRQTRDAGEPLKILCDSQYAINCCTTWIKGWKRRGWKKSDGKPILNRELIQALDAQLQGRQVIFEWVKGHAGHEMNEAADQRARAAATAYRDGTDVPTGPGFRGVVGQGSMDVAPTRLTAEPSLLDLLEEEPGPVATSASTDVDDIWTCERALHEDEIEAVVTRRLGDDAMLLTWRPRDLGARPRTVVWVRTDGRWNMRFVRDASV